MAGVEDADLFIGCSPREEANLVGAMLAKRLSGAQTIVRNTSKAYLDAWRERHLDVDFMVSPGARDRERDHGDARASGRAPDRPVRRRQGPDRRVRRAPDAPHETLVGRNLRHAEIPADSKVAAIIRGDAMIVPRGDEQILPATASW